ncbi:MAG: Exoenzyme S synthesis regulatory protein ExsA [Lentisphaerae bacterium ADurb.Bin242]|nr:MAG: Exoenzyme S synthesis regulatory protein ExsA [Lentisphaerae bacterium ADurb.Bin242]
MEYIHLNMTNVPRRLRFPLPVHSLGYIPHSQPQKGRNVYSGKIEFCIRLGSPGEEFARDIFEGEEFKTPFPHVVVKPPDVEHYYEVKDGREAFYVTYPESVIPALQKAGFGLRPFLWEIVVSSRMTDWMRRLKELFGASRETGVAEQIDLLSFALLEEMFFARQGPVTEENFQEKKIRRIASHLQLHYKEDVEVGTLAAENGFSRRSFFRHWNAVYRTSPFQHVQSLRLAEAERLLCDSDMPVDAIAEQVGFVDSSYFIRLFRKRCGMTPYRYRLRVAGGRERR